MPCTKIYYLTEEAAWLTVNKMYYHERSCRMKVAKSQRVRSTLGPYRCWNCGFWHLGNSSRHVDRHLARFPRGGKR